MPSLPTNQLDADALVIREEIERQTGEKVEFDLDRVIAMCKVIAKTARIGVITDHGEILGLVMGKYAWATDVEEEAYRRLLDKTYKRQLGAKSSMNAKHGKFAPFAPQSAYEEDIKAGRLR